MALVLASCVLEVAAETRQQTERMTTSWTMSRMWYYCTSGCIQQVQIFTDMTFRTSKHCQAVYLYLYLYLQIDIAIYMYLCICLLI